MKNKELAKNVKNLRNRKGLSQEELAENSGLSQRTIQRIENGETEPRGDSLIRLAKTFGVSPDEITDWTVQEDNGFLIGLNLSALSFVVFPLLGVLVPLIMWISKKDKIKNLNELAKQLLNFQITWVMVFFLGYIAIILSAYIRIHFAGDISPSLITPSIFLNIIFTGFMYLYNVFIVVFNTFQIKNYKVARYFPKVNFIGK